MHLRTVMNLDEFLRISWYLRLLDAKIPQVLLKSFSFPCTCFVKMRQKIQTWQNTNCSMLYFLLVSLSASRAASSRGNHPKTWTVHHSFSKSWSLAIDFVFNKHHFDHKRLFHRFVIQTTAVLCASFCGELFSWEQHLKWCSRWAIDVIMTFTIL